jgi:hypothetical protein
MKTYTVIAETASQFQVTVDAETKEEAMEKAELIDGGDFVACESMDSDWRIVDAVEE